MPRNESEYARERLGLYRSLLAAGRFDPPGIFDLALQQLPFKLGESAAEAMLPVAVDDTLNDAADNAVLDLLELLRRRKDNQLAPRAATPGAFGETEERQLAPATLSAHAFAEGIPARGTALAAVRLDPHLDAGVLDAWLLRGHGSFLAEHLAGLFAHACDEDLRSGGTTPYLFLALLAVIDLLEGKKSHAKTGTTKFLTYERLDKAVGFACYAVVETALERALSGLKGKSLAFDAGVYGARVRSMLTPLSFCSIRARALQNDLNPWGLSQTFAEAADAQWVAILDDDPNPRTAEGRLTALFFDDPGLRLRTARLGAVGNARRAILDLLTAYVELEPDLNTQLLALASSDEQLFQQLSKIGRAHV